jgi:hypothetical protein
MKTVTISILLFIGILESCAPIVKLSYGISNPKMESPQSLTRFLEKKRYPLDNQYQIKDSSSYIRIMNDSVFHTLLFRTLIFTGDLKLIEIDTTHCQWSGGYAVERLKKDTVYSINDSISLTGITSFIMPLFDTSGHVDTRKGAYDFIVVNTWAKFIGRLNERIFLSVESVKKREDLKILVINLNLDMQESWHLDKEHRIKLN